MKKFFEIGKGKIKGFNFPEFGFKLRRVQRFPVRLISRVRVRYTDIFNIYYDEIYGGE